jgi:hypothetical protein
VALIGGWKEHQKRGVIVYWAQWDDGFGPGDWRFAIICRPPNEEVREHYGFPEVVHSVLNYENRMQKGARVGCLGELFIEELNRHLTEGHFKKEFEEKLDKHIVHRS